MTVAATAGGNAATKTTSGPQNKSIVPAPIGNFALYATAPFFANPVKLLWQLLEGKWYEESYGHFVRDHTVPFNVAGHFFPCLWLQLLGNFALLDEVNDFVKKKTNGSTDLKLVEATRGGWIIVLLYGVWKAR